MVDTFTPKKRSWIMAQVPQRGSAPELHVRAILRHLGIGYRLNVKGLPGSPDIVTRERRAVIFVHGCFWHRHDGCKFASMPRSRVDYWSAKFVRNVARDRRARAALRERGWKVVVIWTCQLRKDATVVRRLRRLLSEPGGTVGGPAFKSIGQARSITSARALPSRLRKTA